MFDISGNDENSLKKDLTGGNMGNRNKTGLLTSIHLHVKCFYKTTPLFFAAVYRPRANGSELKSTENVCTCLKTYVKSCLRKKRFL